MLGEYVVRRRCKVATTPDGSLREQPERTGDVFHGFVHGPWAPARGTACGRAGPGTRRTATANPAKLLVDPYATALDRRFALHPALLGTAADGRSPDETDSAAFVPKAIAAQAPGMAAPGVRRPWDRTVIYELQVRGFSKANEGIPGPLRGTCAGLAHPRSLEHLASLGVTAVELMPLAAWIDERHLPPLGLANYWGYNPVALMAPDPGLATGGLDELAACVAALHEAGIEVLLDVVLNHTGEGDEHGPTLSLRGLDNATYYRTLPGDGSRYANDAGCGNTLAHDRAPVLRLALDALRHYASHAWNICLAVP